jgi:TusA-related sulfurtransferase
MSETNTLPGTAADRRIDVTGEVCPMTFVRTKLALEALAPGQVLEVRLNAGEPLRNVPRSAKEQGHEVLEIRPEAGGVHVIRIRRA